MDTSELAPDERALREHVESAAFAEGAARGEWRLIGDIEWPHALIAVRAAPRPGAPCEFVLRFDLTGYPVEAPTRRPGARGTATPRRGKRSPTWPPSAR